MNRESFANLRDWVEPAHPGIIDQFDELIHIYEVIRKFQDAIDEVFDTVSRQIGFVVTTTIPVILTVGENGALKELRVASDTLRGTLFEKIPLAVRIEERLDADAGSYPLYLVWYKALRLRLRKDWVEPAHYIRPGLAERFRLQTAVKIRPEVMEPAHWFDPGIRLVEQDVIQILALDQVYPELMLAERVNAIRQSLIKIRPEVMEPAHIGPEIFERGPVMPGVREPAHFNPRDIAGRAENIEQILIQIKRLLERI
jgi:hypothetical protein